MGKVYDGMYVYDKVKYEFPLPSFTINEILDYVEEYCFIDEARYNNPLAKGPTHWRGGGDIWAGYGKTPNGLGGWFISFNAHKINNHISMSYKYEKLIWDIYESVLYIGYYDGVNYYSRQMDIKRKHQLYPKKEGKIKRQALKALNIKIDSDDFILMDNSSLNHESGEGANFTSWASMDFVKSMAHFRIDENLIIQKKLDFINWPNEKPQGLI